MDQNRRNLLKTAAFLFTTSLLPLGLNGWAAGADALGGLGSTAQGRKRLIVLFQRGAVDGLSVVIPYAESIYYDSRPSIAIPDSGSASLLDLDGKFGLHPALAPVLELWKNKSLAFVHACGLNDPTRSHFDAQYFMETGIPGAATNTDGWMNRLLAVLPGTHASTLALALGAVLPRIFEGTMQVANVQLVNDKIQPMQMDRAWNEKAFEKLYNGNDALSLAFHEGYKTRQNLLDDLKKEYQMADNGAPSPKGFPQQVEALAKLLKGDPSIQLVFLDLGGWDTHINQGSSEGYLSKHLNPMGEGLTTLVKSLGSTYQDTVILVMSEFGRTVHENGNGGTDHGHGNAMWVMGGSVKGGRIYGDWPGLSPGSLFEERDLAVTTDFRSIISTVVQKQFNLDSQAMQKVFPVIPAPSADIRSIL